jgi:hypothetical protein
MSLMFRLQASPTESGSIDPVDPDPYSNNVVDPHCFQRGFLSQCGFRSEARESNQCGSGSWSDLDFLDE